MKFTTRPMHVPFGKLIGFIFIAAIFVSMTSPQLIMSLLTSLRQFTIRHYPYQLYKAKTQCLNCAHV